MNRLQNPEDTDQMKTNELSKQDLLISTHKVTSAPF